jgi:3-hydroxyacyl-CoA dehydrogenase
MGQVDVARSGAIAVLRFSNPPVNALSLALRRDLAAALEQVAADAAVQGAVLIGANGSFCAGADIREFNTPDADHAPTIWTINRLIEASTKPIVAAIEGVALGGGLELALACHHRVALESARVGLPEVKLGLLPGAGGTQRLPRLIGVEAALNVMISGEPVPAPMFAKSALFDRVVKDDLLAAAVEVATASATAAAQPGAKRLPRVRDRKLVEPNSDALLQFARNTVRTAFAPFPAPLAIIDCVAAAVKGPTFDDGLAEEFRQFSVLVSGPVSRALRHVFFAERAASRISDVPENTPVRKIESVAIIGAGTMGTGIAINFLNAGIRTQLLEVGKEALERGVVRIRDSYEGQVKKKKMDAAKRDARMALLVPTLEYKDLAQADLVIEAVFEDIGVKEKVFKTLDATMKPGAILASNTSTLDLDAIAAFTKRPQDVIGLHFFSPANIMKLLEVVRGKATGKDVLATAMKLAKTIRKSAVVSGVCDGFIGNRMINQYVLQAMVMVDEGASPQQIDKAIEKFGFAMGPFRMGDLAGNDILWHIRKRQIAEGTLRRQAPIADALCELGRFGQKSGSGWYDYKAGDRNAYPSPVVEKIIDEQRAKAGTPQRKLDNAEIVDRLVFALVNEGAKILEEKIAQRASDIDLVYLTGYGFPVWRGGPMLYADTYGTIEVLGRMRQFAQNPHDDPGFWTPAPLLERLAASGGRFTE